MENRQGVEDTWLFWHQPRSEIDSRKVGAQLTILLITFPPLCGAFLSLGIATCGDSMNYTRAARKPTTFLSLKLHNQIGYALRQYECSVESKGGAVQHKTRCFLASLYDEFCNIDGAEAEWRHKVSSSFDADASSLRHTAIQAPPGLELPLSPTPSSEASSHAEKD